MNSVDSISTHDGSLHTVAIQAKKTTLFNDAKSPTGAIGIKINILI